MARPSLERIWAESPTQFEEPTDAVWTLGWEGGADKDPPEAKWENWWHNRVDVNQRQMEQHGALEWLSSSTYQINGLASDLAGGLYSSQSSNNQGNTPASDDGSNWIKITFGKATSAVYGLFRKATQPQVDAGVVDDAAVTPAKLRFGVDYQLSSNGYLALPSWLGGIVIQWGYASVTGTTDFPIEFPNQCFQAVASDNIDSVPHSMGVGVTSTSIEINSDEPSGGICRYIAIGH